MIGMGAPEDFVHNLEQLANTHHQELSLDQIRAYHFGQRFIVEMEVVLPAQMTVRESHDIALILQHKVRWQTCVAVMMCTMWRHLHQHRQHAYVLVAHTLVTVAMAQAYPAGVIFCIFPLLGCTRHQKQRCSMLSLGLDDISLL